MADTKKKFVTHRSPKGVAVFPRINQPDFKFKKEQGEYSVKLRLTPEEAAGLIEFADAENKKAFATVKEQLATSDDGKKKAKAKSLVLGKPPYEKEVDKEGNETGNFVFKFARTASGVSRQTNKPWKAIIGIFDAKGQPIPRTIEVWGGTEMKVAFYTNDYYVAADNKAGVSFKLEAVQVIKLVTKGERDAAHYGFGEEDGYTAPSADAFGGEADELAGGGFLALFDGAEKPRDF